MSFLQCGSAVHYYRLRAGAQGAPTLAFINGLGTDHRIWDDVVAALPPALSVLVYDLRGQGLSEPGTARYDLSGLAADLEQLLQRLDTGPVVPVGFSLGGLVAQELAHRYPTRLRALVLCATAGRIANVEVWQQRAAQAREGGIAAIADGAMERWFSRDFREREPHQVRGYRRLLLGSDLGSYLSAVGVLAESDLRGRAGELTLPTLLVAASADVATPPDGMRELGAAIRGSHLDVLDGSGHLLGVEQPEALAGCIVQFLKGNGLV
ncbi:MAG: 3-oxoadipate enol-lactonase [Pseudomonadota bacterium]|jgi:3-oxoadipate enol-lactonase